MVFDFTIDSHHTASVNRVIRRRICSFVFQTNERRPGPIIANTVRSLTDRRNYIRVSKQVGQHARMDLLSGTFLQTIIIGSDYKSCGNGDILTCIAPNRPFSRSVFIERCRLIMHNTNTVDYASDRTPLHDRYHCDSLIVSIDYLLIQLPFGIRKK